MKIITSFVVGILLLNMSSCISLGRINKSKLGEIPFEKNRNQSATYEAATAYYKSLAEASKYVQVNDFGMTDAGHPLQEVIIDRDKDFDPAKSRLENKSIMFINNGIHAGEPCGIDASMMLARDILDDKDLFKLLEKTVVVIIPVYNIGGAKNRNSTTRANQNGPEQHGFRGNAKNLDLNRDFIKCDSKNAASFSQLYTKWSPDLFMDTHTSNGSDYQHIITLINTQKDKLAPSLSTYLELEFLPKIYDAMAQDGYDMSPYVFSMGKTPDEKGIASFPDLPRYSSGYAALHHSLSFMPETHMLKNFDERVMSTYTVLLRMLELLDTEGVNIQIKRQEAKQHYLFNFQHPIEWELDRDIHNSTILKGYESTMKTSEISGADRLYYDHDKPFSKEIPLFNKFRPSNTVQAPESYIIPQAYSEIIERLEWNGVSFTRLKKDIELPVQMYYIESYETRKSAYESHYQHYNTKVAPVMRTQQFYKGDYVVSLDQTMNRFIIETLEPEAPDSYFNWNFFDGILMQKEHFSSYVFEDLAVKILEENPDIKTALEEKKKEDEDFAKSAYRQLEFIYLLSEHYEKTHNLYPIARVLR